MAAAASASKLIELKEGESFTFRVLGMEIEDGCCGENYTSGYYDVMGVDVMYPWETSPRREHTHTFDEGAPEVAAFRIDATPVTNEAWLKFVQSGYVPASTQNYLRHWSGAYPAQGAMLQPVRWVSLGDARAFCAWRGASLPSEIQWAFAAQGPDVTRGATRTYPGATWRPIDRSCPLHSVTHPSRLRGSVYVQPAHRHLASWTWPASFGNGRRSLWMSARARGSPPRRFVVPAAWARSIW